jgi:Ca2+-binding RTX toxin-like protein
MTHRIRAGLAVAAVVLAAPATASATSSISVENGAIRFVGDETDNQLDVYRVENGEQSVYVRWDTTIGAGCHTGPPNSDPGPSSGLQGNVHCSRAGVDRIEFVGGDGSDTFTTGSIIDVDIPVHGDMGPGDDRFDFGSTGDDQVAGGPGMDRYVDAGGNDEVDLGDDNDDAYGGDFSSGDDTIHGGAGDDNLDGLTGNDVLDGGPGNDVFQPGEGNDALLGGDGDDVMGGVIGGCLNDVGDDIMSGGPGNDQLCGGPGVDWLDGGDGNDSINAVDSGTDGPIACGAGVDAAWGDPGDRIGTDCELQDDQRTVKLPAPNVLPVAVPCASGPCAGKLSVYATPDAKRPAAATPPPVTPATASGKALLTAKFKLKAKARRTLRLNLSKAAAKRLKKLGATTVEARITFTQAGKSYAVTRTFGVTRR